MLWLQKKNKFDQSHFGLLSSDIRVEILKALDCGCMTLKGLCDEFDLAKSTAYKHIKKLKDAGLIEQVNSGSKFVYYKLTRGERSLLKL